MNGADSTTVQAAATPNTAADRVFTINSGITATIQSMAIVNGGFSDYGSAVQNNGALAIINSSFSNNVANGAGAVYNNAGVMSITGSSFISNSANGGGAILNTGLLDVNNSSFVGNTAPSGAGAIQNNGTMTVSNSTIFGNSAKNSAGGGISNIGIFTVLSSTISQNSTFYHGGGIDNGGIMTITSSTLRGNSADGAGSYGGGAFFNGTLGTVNINNSTLSANLVNFSGGKGGGILNYGILTLVNDTLCGNSAPTSNSGEGISNSGLVTIKNSIVANSTHGGNCDNTVTSAGHNLSSDNTCGFAATGDFNSTNPFLGPLQNNGGPTFTFALHPGSPAIDAGDNSGCLTTDQRGISLPQGARCDMGAYEAVLYKLYLPLILH